MNYSNVSDAFAGIDAGLFCLGVSVMQVPGEGCIERLRMTLQWPPRRNYKKASPAALFHYISGQGTRPDRWMMWSRVKTQTEQELMALMMAAGWRPAMIGGKPSALSPNLLKILHPALTLLKLFFTP